MNNPEELDWGPVIPEFSSEEENSAIHVFNHRFATREDLKRNLDFIFAKLSYFQNHLPEGMIQKVIFDDRGQNIPDEMAQQFAFIISEKAEFNYMTELN